MDPSYRQKVPWNRSFPLPGTTSSNLLFPLLKLFPNRFFPLLKLSRNGPFKLSGTILKLMDSKWILPSLENYLETGSFHRREVSWNGSFPLAGTVYSKVCVPFLKLSRNGPFKLSETILELAISKWILPNPGNYLETYSFHCQELSWNRSFSMPRIVLKWILPITPASDLNIQRYKSVRCIIKERVLERMCHLQEARSWSTSVN
jgi:hypothetical protein